MHRFFTSFLAFALLAAAEPVDTIVSARYVVTMDAQHRVIENGAVAIRGERIVEAGTRADIDRKYQARNRIDEPASLIAPGLINTHTHAPMSLFRGIADDLRLQDWLTKFIFPAEAKNVTAEFVRWGTRLATWKCCSPEPPPTSTCITSKKWSRKKRKRQECGACWVRL